MPGQLAPLRAPHAGHQPHAVVGAPPLVAHLPEPADVTVLRRIRVGVRARRLVGQRRRYRLLQAAAHQAVVRRQLRHPERLLHERRAAEPRRHHVEPLRLAPLDRPHQLRVDEELHHGAPARLARKLGVDHLVVPLAQRARALHPPQDVRPPEPPPVLQRRLHDQPRPAPHRRHRRRRRPVHRRVHPHRAGAEVRHVRRLVRQPPLRQELRRRIPDHRRRRPRPAHHLVVQLHLVPTLQEPRQIPRREPHLSIDQLHVAPPHRPSSPHRPGAVQPEAAPVHRPPRMLQRSAAPRIRRRARARPVSARASGGAPVCAPRSTGAPRRAREAGPAGDRRGAGGGG